MPISKNNQKTYAILGVTFVIIALAFAFVIWNINKPEENATLEEERIQVEAPAAPVRNSQPPNSAPGSNLQPETNGTSESVEE